MSSVFCLTCALEGCLYNITNVICFGMHCPSDMPSKWPQAKIPKITVVCCFTEYPRFVWHGKSCKYHNSMKTRAKDTAFFCQHLL